jgi:hypothetical protein
MTLLVQKPIQLDKKNKKVSLFPCSGTVREFAGFDEFLCLLEAFADVPVLGKIVIVSV